MHRFQLLIPASVYCCSGADRRYVTLQYRWHLRCRRRYQSWRTGGFHWRSFQWPQGRKTSNRSERRHCRHRAILASLLARRQVGRSERGKRYDSWPHLGDRGRNCYRSGLRVRFFRHLYRKRRSSEGRCRGYQNWLQTHWRSHQERRWHRSGESAGASGRRCSSGCNWRRWRIK
ncbi:hypothetical protein [Klebsiella phage vB_KshKPC-M]|nr:hypothetical protein [Klebsiella phage vB_KshKPC-M]